MIKGQIQVGLLMFLGSTLRLAFVEGFSVRSQSEEGELCRWVFKAMEGLLLVLMHSFFTLVDLIMSVVFYLAAEFIISMEAASIGQTRTIVEDV